MSQIPIQTLIRSEGPVSATSSSYLEVLYDDKENIIGYSVSGHPMGPNKKWLNKNKTIDEKKEKATKYLDKLNTLTEPITKNIIKYDTFKGAIKRRKYGFSVVCPQTCKNEFFVNKLFSVKQNYQEALTYYNKVYKDVQSGVQLDNVQKSGTKKSNGNGDSVSIGTQTDDYLSVQQTHQQSCIGKQLQEKIDKKDDSYKKRKTSKYLVKNKSKYDKKKIETKTRPETTEKN